MPHPKKQKFKQNEIMLHLPQRCLISLIYCLCPYCTRAGTEGRENLRATRCRRAHFRPAVWSLRRTRCRPTAPPPKRRCSFLAGRTSSSSLSDLGADSAELRAEPLACAFALRPAPPSWLPAPGMYPQTTPPRLPAHRSPAATILLSALKSLASTDLTGQGDHPVMVFLCPTHVTFTIKSHTCHRSLAMPPSVLNSFLPLPASRKLCAAPSSGGSLGRAFSRRLGSGGLSSSEPGPSEDAPWGDRSAPPAAALPPPLSAHVPATRACMRVRVRGVQR